MTDPTTTADQRRREILSQVASGDLAPEQAAELLAALDREGPTTPPGADAPPDAKSEQAPPPPPPSDGLATGVRTVRIEGALRIVEVHGDPSVREAVASGPHTARRDGDVFVIEGSPDFLSDFDDDDDDDDADYPGGRFRFRGPAWSSARAGVIVGGRRSVHGLHSVRRHPLVIRMHPDLALVAHVEAGTLSVRDVKGPIKATVQAGSAKIRGFASPFDIEVSAGSVTAHGHLAHGSSRVSCDAGSVKLVLDRSSSVKIDASSNLGKVTLPGGAEGPGGIQGLLQSSHQSTVGGGDGELHISVNVGSASVIIDE
ncbi:MAG: hypothetical protein QOG03_1955 [Actinomycetota bacterium]|jgi:hypothetical protein|nr:hypothetical protein [Actinomycetota bacterium]